MHMCEAAGLDGSNIAKICKTSTQGNEADLAVEALLDVGDVLLDLLCSLGIHLHSKCA